MLKKEKSLEDFLGVAVGAKEASLIIAQDEKELEFFAKIMQKHYFEQAQQIVDLFTTAKNYFVVGPTISKDVYDFVTQYPTGQIEIFNNQTMSSQLLSPDYSVSALILLVTKEDLQELQQKGCDLLAMVGLTYQS
ncbi:MAG: hypothetical protein WCL61_00400 [bacterium]